MRWGLLCTSSLTVPSPRVPDHNKKGGGGIPTKRLKEKCKTLKSNVKKKSTLAEIQQAEKQRKGTHFGLDWVDPDGSREKGTERRVGLEGESKTEGYGNMHSRQRSPKKGILEPADALSPPPERGRRAYSLQQPLRSPEILRAGNVLLTN